MNPFVQLLVLALYICFFPILFFIPSLYYPLVRFGFEIGNFFRKRHFLPKVTDPLLLISATKAAELIRNKELKSVDLVNAYICRIKEVNCILNALISDCFQEALKEAAKVDQFMESVDKNSDEVRKLEKEKPLFGIPFTIKDSMDVKGREITIGMPIRQGLISKEDADVVKNTRESGGILLGITNVPECLMSYETHNPIFGVTNNPYDTRRSPGGSSGGEGALVSACGSLIGIGSDIGGSIRIPSFHNGIFGLKATQFFVPTKGQLPEGFNEEGFKKKMHSVGPMVRYIEDIPLCLKAFNPEGVKDLKLDEEIDVSKVKLYFMESLPDGVGAEPVMPVLKEKLREVVEFFEAENGMTTQGISFLEFHEAFDLLMTIVSEGSPLPHFICKDKRELEGAKLPIEIIKSLFGVSKHMFNVLLWIFKGQMDKRTPEEKQLTIEKVERLREKILGIMEKENAVILMPTWPYTPAYHGYAVWADPALTYTGIWNLLSLPALQCPTGLDKNGTPTGLMIVGAPNKDAVLLALGRKIDALYGGWQAPWTK